MTETPAEPRALSAALADAIRDALPDAQCGPEWRSRHAPECRQEDYEEVMVHVNEVLAARESTGAGLDETLVAEAVRDAVHGAWPHAEHVPGCAEVRVAHRSTPRLTADLA